MLFPAASNGGAYNHGHYGAYGRLDAWRSLAGLVCRSREEPLEAVEAAAHTTTLHLVDAWTRWFYQVAWAYATGALSGDGRSLRILVATYTE